MSRRCRHNHAATQKSLSLSSISYKGGGTPGAAGVTNNPHEHPGSAKHPVEMSPPSFPDSRAGEKLSNIPRRMQNIPQKCLLSLNCLDGGERRKVPFSGTASQMVKKAVRCGRFPSCRRAVGNLQEQEQKVAVELLK